MCPLCKRCHTRVSSAVASRDIEQCEELIAKVEFFVRRYRRVPFGGENIRVFRSALPPTGGERT
jgi:hypothetical protein